MQQLEQEHHLIEILLVEDNLDDAFLAQEVLREAKFANHVSHVKDGEQAMAALRSGDKHPDLVLLDLNLPKKDGRQVLAEIKTDPELRMIPVIVLTTSAAEEDVIHAYSNYVNAYVRKPVGFAELVDAMRRIEDFWVGVVTLPPRLK
jgi:chemotaxis family two-component system response regulator Rcp1